MKLEHIVLRAIQLARYEQEERLLAMILGRRLHP